MHMSDALLSPQVGLTMWAFTASSITLAGRRLQEKADTLNVPLMGVAGAFIFAAQMINFAIPGTGSSGHLGGGMILAILLGPWAGFLTLASVLTIQALFFADGGLLALGCNIFNLGFFTCLVAYPVIYRPLAGGHPSSRRLFWASILACTAGLQLGSLGVVLQTTLSGLAELPPGPFALVMQPIHLVIGLLEGMATGLVIGFLQRVEPGLMHGTAAKKTRSRRTVLISLLLATLLAGGGLSLMASANPDGLEWAIRNTAGKGEVSSPSGPVHRITGRIQEKFSFLPDYGFAGPGQEETRGTDSENVPEPRQGTAVSGIVGSLMTLAVVLIAGLAVRIRRRRVQP